MCNTTMMSPSSADAAADDGWGTLHPTLQQFDAPKDIDDGGVDPSDVRTWFPPSDDVAFHTPAASGAEAGAGVAGAAYPKLTYRRLHSQMDACPPWPGASALLLRSFLASSASASASSSAGSSSSSPPPFFAVGVLLPAEMMTELAVVHLCVMSGGRGGGSGSSSSTTVPSCCSAPLDPRSSRSSLLSALDKMGCRGLVTARSMMDKFDLGFLAEPRDDEQNSSSTGADEDDDVTSRLARRIVDVRVVESGRDSQGRRDGSVRWTVLYQDADPKFDDQEAPAAAAAADPQQDPVAAASASLNAAPSLRHPPLLLLRTSGTTSGSGDPSATGPKAVPLTGPQLLYNARRQIAAMALTSKDVALNAMPLFHIGGLSCSFFSVLASGGSVIYSGTFDPDRFLDQLCGGALLSASSRRASAAPPQAQEGGGGSSIVVGVVKPTWYNAVPTMHRSLLLRLRALGKSDAAIVRASNVLRFVRSGAAPLDGDVVAGLNEALSPTGIEELVINSYALSECMPVCVQPLAGTTTDGGNGGSNDNPNKTSPPTVGVPVGPSLRICDPTTGQVLPYGGPDNDREGEICISGPGVISSYLGVPPSAATHTNDGWLRTGDIGWICPKSGHVSITGRIKEMIKRGGEQVWPSVVDEVVRKVDGVTECVTFGVKNELWGEEVAAAVVLDSSKSSSQQEQEQQQQVREAILKACKENLDEYAVPAQILFVQEGDLPKGSSGKYQRNRAAEVLGATAVDTAALRMMEGQRRLTQQTTALSQTSSSSGENDSYDGTAVKTNDDKTRGTRTKQSQQQQSGGIIKADPAIDGVRFVASLFIALNQTGLYPNLTLEKLRGFNVSVPVFFILAAFHLSLSVAGPIKWSNFVGTRLGNFHSLYVITQIIALPSFLVFTCANDTTKACSSFFYRKQIITWVLSTLTGMFGLDNYSNIPTWFLTILYQFVIIFPWVDKWMRSRTRLCQTVVLVIMILLATTISLAIYFAENPDKRVNKIRWTIIAFFPLLLSSMILAYFFLRAKREEMSREEVKETGDAKADADAMALAEAQRVRMLKKRARRWAIITDATTLTLVSLCVIVATVSRCIWLPESTAESMRPDQPPYDVTLYERNPPQSTFKRAEGYGQQAPGRVLVKVCGITRDEWTQFLHDTPNTPTNGRYPTKTGLFIWGLRMGAPIAMLWIYGLAKGHGITARIFRFKPLLKLAPLSYHLYLLHVPMARFYWMATRPDSLGSRRFWYTRFPFYPMPIAWWEFILLVSICLILGHAIEKFLVPLLQPYTVKTGVWVCESIASLFRPRKDIDSSEATMTSEESDSEDEALLAKMDPSPEVQPAKTAPVTTEELIKEKVRGLTGVAVTRDSPLVELGLDSLGATALLSTIRSATPLADKLTVRDLAEIDTIGELVDFLERGNMDAAAADDDADGNMAAYEEQQQDAFNDEDVEAGLVAPTLPGSASGNAKVDRSPDGTVTVVSSKSSQPPSATVVFCHGLGGTGESFVNVAQHLVDQLPHVKFILPSAPARHVSMNNNASAPAWYDIAGHDDRSKENCDGIDESSETVRNILRDEHANYGTPYSRMALAGFSQGGALSLFTGLQLDTANSTPLGGVVMLSGYLPAVDKFALASGLEETPVLHCHGSADEVVPIDAAQDSKNRVVELGATDYQLKTYEGLGHSVSPEELSDVSDFLSRVLPPAHGDAGSSAPARSAAAAGANGVKAKLQRRRSLLITLALLVLSAVAIVIVRATVGAKEVKMNPMMTYQAMSEEESMMMKEKMMSMYGTKSGMTMDGEMKSDMTMGEDDMKSDMMDEGDMEDMKSDAMMEEDYMEDMKSDMMDEEEGDMTMDKGEGDMMMKSGDTSMSKGMMTKDMGPMMHSQMTAAIDPEQLRYNKFTVIDDPTNDPSCSASLPLGPDSYPISGSTLAKSAQCMLRNYTDAVSVVSQSDWEVRRLDVSDLISAVGGPPPNPSSSSSDPYWSELAAVMKMQIKRIRRGGALARVALKTFPLPYRWTELSVRGVAGQVHQEYTGSHQALMIEDLMSGMYGRIEVDSGIIPRRSRVHFLRGVNALAELNQWAIGRVGPYNFAAKWHIGRARPEEVVSAIQNGELSYVPEKILMKAKKLPLTSRMQDFTAFPEGSPRHPSWPAMHAAASGLSFWLPVVLDLTPVQHCQTKLIDFAVSYARVVAGVHYMDDIVAGLDMGQEVIARLLPDYLAETYGSDPAVVKAKVDATRFSWREFDMSDPCPGVQWKLWKCTLRSRRCGFRGPLKTAGVSTADDHYDKVSMMGEMSKGDMKDGGMTMDEMSKGEMKERMNETNYSS